MSAATSTPRALGWALLLCVAAACRPDDSNIARGRGLAIEPLSAADQAAIYRAALEPAFQLDDPALSLLLDSRFLPRVAGLGVGPPMGDSTVRALRDAGTVRGLCAAPPEGTRQTLSCRAARPGYVIRFSEVFRLGVDSVEVHVGVQKYDTPEAGPTQALRFERVYQVVRHGGAWTAVREGRVRQP